MLGTKYIVKKGDTLWDLSKKHLGDPTRWNEIYEHNNQSSVTKVTKSKIVNPNLIFVKQVIYIPKPTKTAAIKKKPSSRVKNLPAPKSKAQARIRNVPFQYQLDEIPKLTVMSPAYVAVVSYSGTLSLQSTRPIDFVTITKSGFEISAKKEADFVLGKLLAETKIGWNAKTKSINFENGITLKASNKFSPSVTVSMGISSDTRLPNAKITIKSPALKGKLNHHNYITGDLAISIEITANQATASPDLNSAYSQSTASPDLNPAYRGTSANGSGWDYILGNAFLAGAAVIIAATIVEDFITFGLGTADDPVSFALAAGMIARGTLLLKKVKTGAALAIEGVSVGVAGEAAFAY